MKKLILAVIAVTCSVSVIAQATVVFNNNITGTIRTHIYAPLPYAPWLSQLGQGTDDTIAGSVSNNCRAGWGLTMALRSAGAVPAL